MRKLIALLPVLIVIVSGCTGINPEDIARASPVVKQFLAEYPNARISATHFTQSQAESMLEVIKQDCDNPYLEAKEFYRFTVDDNETGFKAVAWIDWENQIVECAYKEGYLGKREYGDKEVDPTKCVSKHVRKCANGNAYWHDSCGNKQEKAEKCDYGCAEGKCTQSQCKSRAQANCYGRHMYWFDSCGHVQDKKEYCEYGCERGFCKNKTTNETCFDSDGGKVYYVKGVVETATQRLEDHCNSDGTLTEKYCTDSGTIAAEVIECPNGCLDGACIADNQTDLCEGVTCPSGCQNETDRKYNGTCVEGDCVYEYEYCPNGCLEGACIADNQTDLCEGVTCPSGCQNETDRKYNGACVEGDCIYSYEFCENGCSDGACIPDNQTECAEEGELTSGAVAPEYYIGCCEDLESFDPYPEGWVGGGMLCYDSENGTPVCLGEGTEDEGWFYPNNETALMLMNCTGTNSTA